jgi:hypothetical protein
MAIVATPAAQWPAAARRSPLHDPYQRPSDQQECQRADSCGQSCGRSRVVNIAAAANSGTSPNSPITCGPAHEEVTVNRIRRIGHSLAGLPRRAGALAASAAAAPAALASGPGPLVPGWDKHPPVPLGHVVGPVVKVPGHTVVVGGMPGWQIALIAAGAALLAAALAVLASGGQAARRHQTTGAASAMTASGSLRSRPMRRPS